jgi:hypothetical protein
MRSLLCVYQWPPQLSAFGLEAWWVHLRQAIESTSSFTPPHERGEFLNVGERLSHSGEATVEAPRLEFRCRRPVVVPPVLVALELKSFDKHCILHNYGAAVSRRRFTVC